jgi:WD40 repeat protein/tetratricopeptide (TPR) repeat protein
MTAMRPENPYVAGAPLRGERGFFGRQPTIEWVVRELRNPATNALVLFGQRRIGKTTLLLQLRRYLPADAFLPIYFDLQDQATRPLGEVLADLADTIAEQADMELPVPGDFDDRGRFFRRKFLPQLYQALGERCRPVFLLDEFDVLEQMTERELPGAYATKALFPLLREVMTKDARPAFVFVVGRRAEDLSMNFSATFKSSLEREIWVLDRASAEALVRQAEANDTLHFTNAAVDRVLDLSCCHPYLTQLLCQRLWERAYVARPSVPPGIDVPDVEATVPDALETGDQALNWLWNGLTPPEKIYAAALAEVAGEGEIIAEDHVIRVLSTYAARLRAREMERAPQYLVKRKVLEQTGEREYRFAVELFRRWVRQRRPLRYVKDELDRVEPAAEKLYSVAQDYLRRRDWQTATRHLRSALEVNPRHFRARLDLGDALLELGQIDQAVAELERAYELDRGETRFTLARALVAQARALQRSDDQDRALAASERALRIFPNEREAQEIRTAIWLRRGNAALEQQDLEAALSAYQEAGDAEKIARVQELRQEEAELARLFDEGVMALRQQAWERARDAFADVVRQRPDYERDGQRADHLLRRARMQRPMPAARETAARRWPAWAPVLAGALLAIALVSGGLVIPSLLRGTLTPTSEVTPGTPGVTSTPTPAPPTPTPTLAVSLAGTPVAQPVEAITPENAERVTQLARWGQGMLYGMALSPDGSLLAVATSLGIYLHDATTLDQVRLIQTGVWIFSVAFSPDGQMLASGADDGTTQLWQVSDGLLLDTLEGHANRVNGVAFSPDGEVLASGSEDGTVILRQVSDWTLLTTPTGHTGAVNGVAFSPDGQVLASGSTDGTVRLWQVVDGTPLNTLGDNENGVHDVGFSPDGKMLASGMEDGTVRLWRVADGSMLNTLEGMESAVNSVAFSPDGERLATGAMDATVRLWQVADGLPLDTLARHRAVVYGVAFAPNGERLVAGAWDGTLWSWRVADGRLLATQEGQAAAVGSVDFSPDGETLALGSWDRRVRLLQALDGTLLRTLTGHTMLLNAVTFSDSGEMLASAAWENTVRLWRVSDGKLLKSLVGPTGYLKSVAFSPDSKTVAAGSSDGQVWLWQTEDGAKLDPLTGHTGMVNSVAFSLVGELLASGSEDGTVQLWRTTDWKALDSLQGEEEELSSVKSVTFSLDGKLLASGLGNGTVQLWQVEDRALLTTLAGHTEVVVSVAFSPDGKTLASGSGDRTVRLWDVDEKSLLGILTGHASGVLSVAFSLDGATLASGSADGTLRLWGVPVE